AMPVDRCWHRKLVNNFQMKSRVFNRAVTLLSIGLGKSPDLYCFAQHSDRRLARKEFNGSWFATGFRWSGAQCAYRCCCNKQSRFPDVVTFHDETGRQCGAHIGAVLEINRRASNTESTNS